MRPFPRLDVRRTVSLTVALVLLATLGSPSEARKKKKDKPVEDPYAEYVWPPPPDMARIKLETILTGRADVEARGKFKKALLGASPQSAYDRLVKPFAVAFDPEGRILVTDSGTAAVIRFDQEGERMDVLGTRGNVRLRLPLGLSVSPTGAIYVADAGLKRVLALDPEGKVIGVYGRGDDLENPTDVALSPDGRQLYVADSKAHQIVVFDLDVGERVDAFGKRGSGEVEFNYPTSLTFDAEGNLLVVDQMNSRVQVIDAEREFVGEFGSLGVGFANFVRPKDVAVDDVGFIYVTDNAFNNVQLFDLDYSLLTYVGEGGSGPGRFLGASGVAVQGDSFAVVDQLGRRVQIFRFIVPKDE